MQSKSRPLDDLTNLVTNAVGAVKGVGDEVKAIGRSQAERIYEVLKAMFEKSQAEIEALRKEVKKLKKAQNKQV